MTALAHERPETMPDTGIEHAVNDADASELDKTLWQAWKAMELPEGYHAEIIEGAIDVSPTGRVTHAQAANRVRRALDRYLAGGDHAAHQDTNVIHRLKSWIPDAFVGPEDLELYADEDGLGVKAEAVSLVVEVVSPGKHNQDRDRTRKRREYARAGIAVYVLIDDYDDGGTVTVLSDPRRDRADWAVVHRAPYGSEVTVPEGPAKGFVIDRAITGPRRT
ncbi:MULTISPECIES: Uma2 family endonuclease [unclassified Streptomyces]|uniref:Uma2 family endonuclease n=1 Tax=unclassified Streptomyces TaxID=2593676 RepID=UPI000DBA4B12|nr:MULTISPECIES: Uma2 family endonuclease [unclassified Streptomyces]MYT69995.1 Uma2 family endonuclease [Streptomyces sp. SID8367]RAJ88571.1 putative restriction endonuclease [Streptomyces sp. PsTaAH-137]